MRKQVKEVHRVVLCGGFLRGEMAKQAMNLLGGTVYSINEKTFMIEGGFTMSFMYEGYPDEGPTPDEVYTAICDDDFPELLVSEEGVVEKLTFTYEFPDYTLEIIGNGAGYDEFGMDYYEC